MIYQTESDSGFRIENKISDQSCSCLNHPKMRSVKNVPYLKHHKIPVSAWSESVSDSLPADALNAQHDLFDRIVS